MAYTDDLEDTDGVDLPAHNALWVTPVAGITLEIQGGTACGTNSGGSFNSNYYNNTFADKHYSIALTHASYSEYAGPTVRAQTTNSFYYAHMSNGGVVSAGECIAGVGTDWDGGQSGWTAGDTIELWIDATTSTTIHLKRNGTTIATYTGKSLLTGGKAGLESVNAMTVQQIASWEGGDVGAGAAANILQSWQQKAAMGALVSM